MIRAGQKLPSFLLNNGRVLADLLQPLMPASLMILRPLPQLLPTHCRGIQLPALIPLHRQKTAAFLHWKECGGRVEGLVTAGDMLAAMKCQLLKNNPRISFSNAVLTAEMFSLLLRL